MRIAQFFVLTATLSLALPGCSAESGHIEPAPSITADAIVGRVVGVSDGDTITVLDSSKTQHKVRLEGIDAPESHQAFGARAKQALSERVFGKDVRVAVKGRDRYGRELGHVYVGEQWINRELIASGFAWHYKQYSSSAELAAAEISARAAAAGLWSGSDPVPPWDFRHSADAAAKGMELPAPSTSGTIVFITGNGTKYHAANCRFLAKSSTPLPLADAAAKYQPCSVCRPPVANLSGSPVPGVRMSLASATTSVAPATATDPMVYVTETGSKYHSAGCRSLSKSMIPMKLNDAKKKYGTCSVCKPP